MKKLSLLKMVCIVFVFCAAMAPALPAQVLTTLNSFDGTDGKGANGPVQGSDGNFYGTTEYGGSYLDGTVFKITPEGTLTTLYSFCSQQNCTDGEGPDAGLIQASDGNFYGTTAIGGAKTSYGTVFRITPSGTLTVLYNFCSESGCADGAGPRAALVQASDGNFYGTTWEGGAGTNCASYGCGTVFKIRPDGTLTTLYSFDV